MKLSEIKTKKLFLQYLAEMITKMADLEAVEKVVFTQRYTFYVKDAIKECNLTKVTSGLARLSALGATNRIQEIYKTVQDENVKKRFAKYIA